MPDRRLALAGVLLIGWAACGHASGAGGTVRPPVPDWSLRDVRVAQVYAVAGAPVIVTLDNGGHLSIVDAATGRPRMRAEPPRGVRWDYEIVLADATLVVEGSRGKNRFATSLDIATGRPHWTAPLQEFQHLVGGLDGTGVGLMEWGGDCVADVIDGATGAPVAKRIPGRQVRVNPRDSRDFNEHYFVCGAAITILGAARGDTFVMYHAGESGLYVVNARGARRLAESDEVLAAGRAGDVAWARTYRGLFVAGMDLAASRIRWQRTFAEETCEYEEGLEEPACQARLVSVPGRAPFLLVTTGVTTTALAPSDGRVLWTNRGRRHALAVIVGEPRADAKGENQKAFGTRLGTLWLDPDGRVLGEVPPPEPRPYGGRQLPVGDDAVLVQRDRQVTLVGRNGKPRWSVSPAANEFYVDDIVEGCALVRVEDFSTRHLRFIDLRDGRLVTEIRDVEPVLAVVRTPRQPTRLLLQPMKGGLMSVPVPCARATP